MRITVYSQPNCMPCKGTYRALDKAGLQYEVVDISEDHDARQYVLGLGYQKTPVIVTESGEHWSDYRPDKIRALATA